MDTFTFHAGGEAFSTASRRQRNSLIVSAPILKFRCSYTFYTEKRNWQNDFFID